MQVKDLSKAIATFARQLQDKVRRLTEDATTLEVSTYTTGKRQLADVVNEADVTAADPARVRRQGFTRITFDCDLSSCTQTGRTDDVAPAVAVMHRASVDGAVAAREAVLGAGYEVLARMR